MSRITWPWRVVDDGPPWGSIPVVREYHPHRRRDGMVVWKPGIKLRLSIVTSLAVKIIIAGSRYGDYTLQRDSLNNLPVSGSHWAAEAMLKEWQVEAVSRHLDPPKWLSQVKEVW